MGSNTALMKRLSPSENPIAKPMTIANSSARPKALAVSARCGRNWADPMNLAMKEAV